jgi:hypothetical protein
VAALQSARIFRLNADPAFVAFAHVTHNRAFKAGSATNGLEASPTPLPAVDQLTAPIAFVADRSHAERHELDGR